MQERRPYRMKARAETAAATGERILDAATELFWERSGDEVPLDEVARRAGVSARTVIRRFGGKDGLMAAGSRREIERVERQRGEAPAGDLRGAVRNLVDHYEELGDRVLGLLAEERRRRLAQLVAVCDVYTWKLLRRDRGLSRRETERALVELLEPLTIGA
jgi:AcrR family transcriptional regulator